jgi:hypothetical protein
MSDQYTQFRQNDVFLVVTHSPMNPSSSNNPGRNTHRSQSPRSLQTCDSDPPPKTLTTSSAHAQDDRSALYDLTRGAYDFDDDPQSLTVGVCSGRQCLTGFASKTHSFKFLADQEHPDA